ncbi:MAG: hypothetical protein ACXVIY_03355 [Mucilaginibacter sp.]
MSIVNCTLSGNVFKQTPVIVDDKEKIFKLTVMTLWVKKSYTN